MGLLSPADPDNGWLRKIWLEAVDEHGREISAVGQIASHHGAEGQGTGHFQREWDGASGYGETNRALAVSSSLRWTKQASGRSTHK
jgi:hypothetical protein